MAPSPFERSGPIRFSQISSPVRASKAWTMFPGLARNITPLWTIGVGSLAAVLSFMAHDHTNWSCLTLPVLIWVSGLLLQAW